MNRIIEICKVLLEVYRDYFLQWDWHQPPTCERQQISCVDFFPFFIFLRIFFFFDNECRVVQLVKFEGVTYWASKVIVSWKKNVGLYLAVGYIFFLKGRHEHAAFLFLYF